eukprot:gene16046-20677_t
MPCSVQGLLNKVSAEPVKYDALLPQLCDALEDEHDRGGAPRVAAAFGAIHRRAVAEPGFTSVYADVATDMLRLLRRRVPTPALLAALNTRCEETHREETATAPSGDAPRPRLVGNMRFLGELYNRCVAPTELCLSLLA